MRESKKCLKAFYPEIFFVTGNGFKSGGISIQVKTQQSAIEQRMQALDDLQCFCCHKGADNTVQDIQGGYSFIIRVGFISGPLGIKASE
jgi:hypothetical protein